MTITRPEAAARLVAAGLDQADAETLAAELVPAEVDPMRALVEALFGRGTSDDDTTPDPPTPGRAPTEKGTPDRTGGTSEMADFVAALFGR